MRRLPPKEERPGGDPVRPPAEKRFERPKTSRGEPDWVREAFLTEEVRRYGRTLRDLLLRPRTFAARWVVDEGDYQNPVRFLAVSTTVIALLMKGAGELLDSEHHPGFVRSVLLSIVPYAYFLTFGVLTHLVLRRAGPTRQWSSTAAMAMYSGGGPAAIASWLVFATSLGLKAAGRLGETGLLSAQVPAIVRGLLLLLALFVLVAFYVWFTPLLAGLHGIGLPRTLTAVVIAFFSASILLGLWPNLELPGVIPFRLVYRDGGLYPSF